MVRGPYASPDKEVIVVDDGSNDRTSSLLERWDGQEGIRVLRHPSNRGKGAAVRTGLAHARGTITIIQDADLESDPNEYPLLVERIRRGQNLVVYGSRYLLESPGQGWTKYRLAVCLLSGPGRKRVQSEKKPEKDTPRSSPLRPPQTPPLPPAAVVPEKPSRLLDPCRRPCQDGRVMQPRTSSPQ